MTEQWRPVAGWEGFYEVSDLGRVKSLPRTTIRRDGRRQVTKGRVLSGKSVDGYRTVAMRRPGVYTTGRIHRMVLEAFVGPCPEGQEACHNNGDRADNQLSNLRWDTKSANTLDKIAHGTHPQARLTHCPQGHPYDDANTYRRPGQISRSCRTCSRARSIIHKAKEKGLTDHEVDIVVVGRQVAANAMGEYPTAPEWENYPEIGEFDWEEVLAHVDQIRDGLLVEHFVYEECYRRLQARADDGLLPDGTFTLDPMEATA